MKHDMYLLFRESVIVLSWFSFPIAQINNITNFLYLEKKAPNKDSFLLDAMRLLHSLLLADKCAGWPMIRVSPLPLSLSASVRSGPGAGLWWLLTPQFTRHLILHQIIPVRGQVQDKSQVQLRSRPGIMTPRQPGHTIDLTRPRLRSLSAFLGALQIISHDTLHPSETFLSPSFYHRISSFL